MRISCTLLFLVFCISLQAQTQSASPGNSPLAAYSGEWNKPVYAKCNTAEKISWLSNKEKNVIYVLNLVRTYPQLFANTVLKQYPERTGNNHLLHDTFYFQSLMKTLLAMKPVPLLQADKDCYASAQCHAYQSGITGYVGHERKTDDCRKKKYFNGECCDYGHDDAVEIVLSLLIDEGVESLGHRSICLDSYDKVAVSIQTHKVWRFNAVLDFHF